MNKQDLKNLKKRYLIWLYKTTKDALDKIGRKFTQLEIDRLLLKELRKLDKDNKVKKFIDEFDVYAQNKKTEAMNLKYDNGQVKPEYDFLDLKLKSVERVITKEFGKKVLKEIKLLYEIEMTERILKSTEQK